MFTVFDILNGKKTELGIFFLPHLNLPLTYCSVSESSFLRRELSLTLAVLFSFFGIKF